MTTIQVTVENTSQAKMLVKWLNEIKFVKKTTLQKETSQKGNAEKINKMLSKIEPGQLFTEIDDHYKIKNK